VCQVSRLGGDTDDINNLWWCYQENLLLKDVVAATLRAHQTVKDEVTTKRRDFAKRFQQLMRRNNNGWE